MRIPLNKTTHFDADGFSGNIYVDLVNNLGFNALEVVVNGKHYKTLLKNATRMYLILEGKGTFTINDKVEHITKGDLYIVSHGQTYQYEGSMKLFEFNIPATDESNEENLDEK